MFCSIRSDINQRDRKMSVTIFSPDDFLKLTQVRMAGCSACNALKTYGRESECKVMKATKFMD